MLWSKEKSLSRAGNRTSAVHDVARSSVLQTFIQSQATQRHIREDHKMYYDAVCTDFLGMQN
jgi:hypothetical protein